MKNGDAENVASARVVTWRPTLDHIDCCQSVSHCKIWTWPEIIIGRQPSPRPRADDVASVDSVALDQLARRLTLLILLISSCSTLCRYRRMLHLHSGDVMTLKNKEG